LGNECGWEGATLSRLAADSSMHGKWKPPPEERRQGISGSKDKTSSTGTEATTAGNDTSALKEVADKEVAPRFLQAVTQVQEGAASARLRL